MDIQVVLMDKLELASGPEGALNAVVLVDMSHKDLKYKTLPTNLKTVMVSLGHSKNVITNKYF